MKLKRRPSKPRPYAQGARALSAEATARRVVDAFLARLSTQWFDEITLDLVAADARVSVQTVVRRFGGKEGLLSSAVKVMGAQITARRAAPAGDVSRLVRNLVEDYERTGDAVIRLLALESRHASLRVVLEYGRGEHRGWVETGFAQALARLDAAARRRAVDSLVVATDVYAWKLLRRDMARSGAATTATMEGMVRATLAEISNASTSGAGT